MADLRLPSLLPKIVDATWFCVDKRVDDHEELCKLEEEHQTWVGVIFRLSLATRRPCGSGSGSGCIIGKLPSISRQCREVT